MNTSEGIIYTSEAEPKIQKILHEGVDHVQIIADFDKTLTYGNQPGLIAVLYNQQYLSEEYSQKAKILEKFYLPKEEDPQIPLEDRKMIMQEWRQKHNQLLIESGLSKSHIEKVVNSGIIQLREGCYPLLDQLKELGIPMTILSASGLGKDSISLYFHKNLEQHQKLWIIANEFIWDENGKAISRKEPLITSLNKNETIISEQTFPTLFQEIATRDNVILLGDKIEDITMTEGIYTETVLKIGYLDTRTEEKKALYRQYYDIILHGSLGMQEIQTIIKRFEKR